MSSRRRRVAAGALVTFLVLVGCGETGTEPGEPMAYFPLQPENSWTYLPEEGFPGDPFTWTVTDRRGDSVWVDRPFYGSHAGPVILLDGTEYVDLITDTGAVPYYRFATDTPWVHRDPWSCDDGAVMVAVGMETVVTPAGTFPGCLRLERLSQTPCDDAGTMVEWWAPDVGLVRWEELNFWAGGPVGYELVAYDVAG